MKVNSKEAQSVLDEGKYAITSGGYYFFSDGKGHHYYLAYGEWPSNIRAGPRVDLVKSFKNTNWTVVKKGTKEPVESLNEEVV